MRFGLREAIYVLLLLAMPASAYLTVFKQRAAADQVAREDIAEVQKKIKRVSLATAAIPDLSAEIDKLQAAIDHFQSKLPTDQEIQTLLKDVWDIAAKHGLNATSLTPEKAVASARYTERPIKMEITGDFFGFYNFMNEIERLPRITRMPKIAVQRSNREAPGQVKAKLTLSIFFEGRGGDA